MPPRWPPFRAGRWHRLRRWLGLAAALAAAAVGVAAAAANAQVPSLRWQSAGHLPASGGAALALAWDPVSQALYAGMARGLFVSRDGGADWAPLAASGAPLAASSLAFDARQARLYGSDGLNVFRQAGDGWQIFSLTAAGGAQDLSAAGRPAIWAVLADERQGLLYVGSLKEFLRSRDGGTTWEWVGTLPAEGQALALDDDQGDLYAAALANGALYRSRNGGRTWSTLDQDALAVPLADLAGWDQWGVMGRWVDGQLFWAAENMHGLWQLPRVLLESRNCVVQPRSGSQAELLCAWGLNVLRSDLPAMPLPWLVVRLWIWQVTAWVSGHVGLAAAGLAAGAGLALLASLGDAYLHIARPWGVPVWVAVLAPGRVAQQARPAALDQAWPAWEQQVRAELARFDDAIPADLIGIPGPLRRYVLQRYAAQTAPLEWLDVCPGRLRVRAEAGTRRWRAAGRRPAGDQEAGRQTAGAQASLLADTLGARLGEAQVFDGAWVYSAAGAALPLAAPAQFVLMVLETAWLDTLSALAHRLQSNPDALGLLVPLAGEAGAAELRQAAQHLAALPNCLVLSPADVSKLLLARAPRQVLADWIAQPGASEKENP